MKLLLLVLPALVMANVYVKGTLQSTYSHQYNKPSEDSFHVNPDELTNILTLESKYLANNYETVLRLSNKFDDKVIEKASMSYVGRHCNHAYKTEIGTINTFQGILSEDKLPNEQNPYIFKNHGVYNDEFLSGFLANTMGIQQSYTYIIDYTYLFTVKYSLVKPRELSKARAERAFYGYESKYLDLDFNKPFTSLDIQFDYENAFNMFYNKADIEVGAKGTDLVPDNPMAKYLTEGDASIFVPTTNYRVELNRFGFSYKNEYILYGFDSFLMHLSNEDLGVDYEADGYFNYLALYLADTITAYSSYGVSTNTKKGSMDSIEKIVGLRYNLAKDITVLAEWKNSNWIQNTSFEDYKVAKSSGDRDISMYSVQVMYRF